MSKRIDSVAVALAARRAKALAVAARQVKGRCDAALITSVEDVSYLSGFTGDDSFLLMAPGKAWLLTDGRYGEQAAGECPGVQIDVRSGSMSAAIAAVLKSIRAKRLAVQAEHLNLRWKQAIEQARPSLRIVATTDLTGAMRQVKSPDELAAIRKAVRAAEDGFKALTAQGARAFVGRTEREVAGELEYRMRLAGADKAAFDTIVAAGAHGSLPHYRPSDTRIGKDDPVLIDWGAFVEGYCSDLTRVVFPGRIPPKLAEIYQVVRRAQVAGIAAVRAGRTLKSIDAAARRVIAQAGYGEQFIHSLGHGIGRQIHEAPSLSRLAKGSLRAGTVVTVEPGIYVAGLGGVRIEDDVLATATGRRRLTSLPTALEAMILR